MLHYRAPLLELPVRFDLARLRADADQFPLHLWCPDRLSDGMPGAYTTLALVAHRGRESNEMFGPFAPTSFLEACPYFRRVLAWFEAPVCEVRLRWLGPRTAGAFHFDRHRLLEDRYRVHVPIYTTPHAHFYCGDRVAQMPAGTAWTFDRMKRHSVFNDDPSIRRLHLIMDFLPSEKIRSLVERAAESLDDAPLAPLEASGPEPRLAFAREGCPAVWPPDRLRDELAQLRARFEDDAHFAALEPETRAFVERWAAVWERHGEAKGGWAAYQKLARAYYAAWRSRVPIPDVTDVRCETSWIACLLDTGAYVPSSASSAPSWKPNERMQLVDTAWIAIGTDGGARISLDGGSGRAMPPSAVSALLELVHGGTPKSVRAALGRKRFDEAMGTLRWLADEGALRAADDVHQLELLHGPRSRANGRSALVIPPATMARLVSLRAQLGHGARFAAARELRFILRPNGAVGAYLPHVAGYDLLFPDALAIAQYMALGLTVDEIAAATGYNASDDFVLFVAWLWDVLPMTTEGDARLRRASFVQRLEAGRAVALPTVSALVDSVQVVNALAEAGSCAIVVDARGPCSPGSIRGVAAAARVKHVDVLVKTSSRATVADFADLPVAGFVVSDCDVEVLGDVARALSGRAEERPFVLGVVESLRALGELEAIARSPWVDALVVGAGDLGRSAMLAGVDPAATVARAEREVRRLAARHGKRLAAVVYDPRSEREALKRGASILLRGTDVTVLAEGIRPYGPPAATRSRSRRQGR